MGNVEKFFSLTSMYYLLKHILAGRDSYAREVVVGKTICLWVKYPLQAFTHDRRLDDCV